MPGLSKSEKEQKVREFLTFLRSLPVQDVLRIIQQLNLILSEKNDGYKNDNQEIIQG